MGFHNIEKKDFWYILLKRWLVDPWHNFVFYRKIIINNKDRIPKNGNLIFTPNHQNALLDALALLCTIDRQLIFLARSDIFKKKKIAKILYFLKILPVFRMRDGYSSVKRNTETFDKTVDVLKAGNGLVILPEGDYERKQKLRPLKKGFARIAFQTEETNDFNLDLKIVPVGLHYTDYDEQRGELVINFGHPIPVSDYYDSYKRSSAIGINQITKKLTESLRSLILDLPDEDYIFFNDLTNIYVFILKQLDEYQYKDLRIEKEFVESLTSFKEQKPREFDELKLIHGKITNLHHKIGLPKQPIFFTPQSPLLVVFSILKLILGLPFFLYGAINNALPFLFTRFFVNKVKDDGFKSSIRFVVSLLIFLIFYLLQTSVLFIFSNSYWWLPLVYFATLILFWNYSVYYVKKCRMTYYDMKIVLISIFRKTIYRELLSYQMKLTRIVGVFFKDTDKLKHL